MKTVKTPIRFKFDVDKFIACVSFFANKKLKGLTKLKICKLLYYTDKFHLIKHGRPVTGDIYFSMDNGPVPSISKYIMDELVSRDEVNTNDGEETNIDKFSRYLRISRGLQYKYPIFILKQMPDLECFSESEIETLEGISKIYGQYTARELVDMTHKEAPWQKSSLNAEIDYRLFFENEANSRPEALEYMESMQENTELILGLELKCA